MKKFLIIYDKEQYAVNEWFANRLRERLSLEGSAEIVLKEETDFYATGKELPDVAVVRTIDPGLSGYLESRGVRVVNNSRISKICNDKRLSYELASEAGVPFAEYFPIMPGESFPGNDAYPLVLKTVSGHGGKGVRLCCSEEELKASLDLFPRDEMIAQKLVGDGRSGRDLRVYVLGGRIFKAVLRVSENDFRSNFSLGGRALPYGLDPKERRTVMKIVKALGSPDLIGVDFLVHDGGLLFNEIEDVVGTRMLYSVYGIDAAKVFGDYICKLPRG